MKDTLMPFGGTIPRIERNQLPLDKAEIAVNCKLWTGGLQSFGGLQQRSALAKPGTIQSIFRYGKTPGDDSSGIFLHWPEDVDVAIAPKPGDAEDTVIFTGDGKPKISFSSIITSGASLEYPNLDFELGVPLPETAPTLVVSGDPAEGVDVNKDVIVYSYVCAFVTEDGRQGPPSPVSNQENWLPGQTRTLNNFPLAPSGNHNINRLRIYRTVGDGTGERRFRVGTIDISAASFEDGTADDNVDLGTDELPSLFWFPPEDDLKGIGVLDNGCAYGFSGNRVFVSEPYLPHAWNPFNEQPTTYPVVGIGHFGNTIVAITNEHPILIQGFNHNALAKRVLVNEQGCISKRSVISASFGVVYASTDGLILVNNGATENITQGVFDQDSWRDLNPHSLLGVLYDDNYLGFFEKAGGEKGAFMFNPANVSQGVVWFDFHATGAYRDPIADRLFLVVDNQVVFFDGDGRLVKQWRSSERQYLRDVELGCVRALANDYDDLTYNQYSDGVLVGSVGITSNKPVRVPGVAGQHRNNIQHELTGTSHITRVDVAESFSELLVL